ncbi:endonuclease/exonuclease/phosphatase family protein [Gilvimarinus sp. SDUM040013]|uniref:Endonuclease/exonuclease/phosphatase family protein n=1 Tax=Gilvimarinus gilvus TaxID=3058038 RepID=A0ABU4RXB2_9GAMM|nr:endonuclease/exonuclease/phosphatase family protein [Gilvimarinus sp. SDUM040013]MDO3386782.1 endonuclease/exonuclease/phosphatase family protein [Gilvimarinus sp. SDUM040013]MDX6848288.1 endonuclease/exonuclease/phosphatase family protein [Gilvimarinus sp. SDUM040013]
MIRTLLKWAAALCMLWGSAIGVVASEQESAALTVQVNSVAACRQALAESRVAEAAHIYQLPEQLHLVSWNIYKANRDNLLSDLQQLAGTADILLLQEAFVDERLTRLKPYWRFAPGYVDGNRATGVLTLSPWPARVHCRFTHLEPWLRTPKATAVLEYQSSAGLLLAVNLHAVNFEFGIEAFTAQLSDVRKLVEDHSGPVVLAGDFNTWSEERTALVSEYFSALELTPANFSQDNRTTTFGNALDHIWTRGVKITASEVPLHNSSDHNPLLITFRFNPAVANK